MHRGAAINHDLTTAAVARLGAFWLRFDLGQMPGEYLRSALAILPVVVTAQGAALWYK